MLKTVCLKPFLYNNITNISCELALQVFTNKLVIILVINYYIIQSVIVHIYEIVNIKSRLGICTGTLKVTEGNCLKSIGRNDNFQKHDVYLNGLNNSIPR